ncbi:MAG: glycosyltransferase family 2 protein [Gemmatimonadales bacterium]
MLFWLAVLVLAAVALSFVGLLVGSRQLPQLAEIEPVADAAAPSVSIVVAARNEARGIEAGLRSLLALDYPALEIVVVDDRSTDATPDVLARMAQSEPRIVPVRVDQLPERWLGKNHALFVGSTRARGEWLLFVDADVVLAPDVLRRAMGRALSAGRDHITITPTLELPGPLLQGFAVFFSASFLLFTQPWKAPDPKSRQFIGVGAFNLVRREAYVRAGTHERIALRPDDDLKLGKILKQSGAGQELVQGLGAVRVEWYHSLGELIRGLEKNAFAGLDYNLGLAIAGAGSQLFLNFLPFLAIAFGSGSTRAVGLATVLASVLGFGLVAREVGVAPSRALLYPLVVLLFAFIVLRTAALNLAQGGIRWRDTFYPLSLLKTNKV